LVDDKQIKIRFLTRDEASSLILGCQRETGRYRTLTAKENIFMPCNVCETGFQGSQSVVVSIQKSGASALVYVQNQGTNIVQLRRIVLCATSPGSTTFLFLRPPPDAIAWTYPSAFLETGITALYYILNNVPAGSIVQAQAEYMEIDGRSRSCPMSF
jgi:hypothetical protein